MFPPAPWTAFATILLPCKTTILGSIVILPPAEVGPPLTDELISLLTKRMRSTARMSMFPPLAWSALAVTECRASRTVGPR